MFEAPSTKLVCIYNVVHIRLVNLMIANKDPVNTVCNFVTLLKLNGHIQWNKFDFSDIIVAYVDGDAGKVNAVRKIDGLMKGQGSFE